ncbi:response regulator [Thermodesulfobacteriota bacterium]
MSFGKKISVLLVFSDENIINLFKTIFITKYNANLDVAKDIYAFNKFTKATRYDIILIDIVFSKSFYSTLKEFRDNEESSSIPVLFFSSSRDKADYERSVDLKAFDIIIKPFDLSHVYSIIDYIISQEGRKLDVMNRRQAERISDKVTLKFQVIGGGHENLRYKATADNISVTGAQFTKGAELADSRDLELEIIISDTYGITSIEAKGIVQWMKKNTQESVTVGVEFIGLDDEDKQRLNKALFAS